MKAAKFAYFLQFGNAKKIRYLC